MSYERRYRDATTGKKLCLEICVFTLLMFISHRIFDKKSGCYTAYLHFGATRR